MAKFGLYLFLLVTGFCCTERPAVLTARQISGIQESVRVMADGIARDVGKEGPAAWLRYFENSTDFFMADEGALVFPNRDLAAVFIRDKLVKNIRHIDLRWSYVRVDPLTPSLAGIGSQFQEEITDVTGKKTALEGYFTAIVRRGPDGWKLHNAHWSVKKG